MKKAYIVMALFVALGVILLCSCDKLYGGKSSVSDTSSSVNSTLSADIESDDGKNDSSDVSLTNSEQSDISNQSSDISSEDVISDISAEESSESGSEESSEPPVAQPLATPYFELLQSGCYKCVTVEALQVGSESIPYTTTAYYKDGKIYVEIEESGSRTRMLITADGMYTINKSAKNIIVTQLNEDYMPKPLFTGTPSLIKTGSTKMYDRQYTYESYSSENGDSFDMLFDSNGTLERIRRYNDILKTYDVITVTLTDETDESLFILPEDYTMEDKRN